MYVLHQVCCGDKVGTLFCVNPEHMAKLDLEEDSDSLAAAVTAQAEAARTGGRQLQVRYFTHVVLELQSTSH